MKVNAIQFAHEDEVLFVTSDMTKHKLIQHLIRYYKEELDVEVDIEELIDYDGYLIILERGCKLTQPYYLHHQMIYVSVVDVY